MVFETRPLSDFATLSSGGTPAKGKAEYWNGGIPWLTPKDMSRFDGTTTDTVTEAAIGKGTRLAPPNSLFIAVRGMSLHNEIRIVRPRTQMSFNQDIKAIIPKSIVDGRFLYFAMQAKVGDLLTSVESAGHGTGRLPTDKLQDLPIPDLPLSEQQAIASILGALDDKIEVNRRMNETLEAMARAIFKDWFVDFGPTRAKMAMRGEDPQNENAARAPYLAPDLWSLFPDRLDDEGKPEGWTTGRLDALGEVTIGGLWGNDEPHSIEEMAFACLRGVDIQHLREQGSANKTPRRYGKKQAVEKRSIGPRDVLVASSGAGPCGRSLWVGLDRFFNKQPTTYSNFVKRISCISDAAACFVDRTLYEMRQSGEINQYITGTSVPNLNDRGLMTSHGVVLPPESLMVHFRDFSLMVQRHLFSGENETLAATRDFLLPQLMSGEIRVKDAEKLAGEIT